MKKDIEKIKEVIAQMPLKIPEDIEEGSYRWYRYIYTNMYKSILGVMTVENRGILLEISKKLNPEHLICWTREKMYPIRQDGDYLKSYRNTLFDVINMTNDADTLRVAICLLRMIQHGDFYVDDHCINHIPVLSSYIKE